MVTKESDYGQQYKEYTTQAAGNKAYIGIKSIQLRPQAIKPI